MTKQNKAALDALDTINRTILAFIEINERQDILSSVKKDIKAIRAALENAPEWDGLYKIMRKLKSAELELWIYNNDPRPRGDSVKIVQEME